jgi:hypothetical protein
MGRAKLSRDSVRWLFLEGIAVVVGILLAFWIDAWWQGRQNLEKEAAVLSSLLLEMKELERNLRDKSIYIPAIKASLRKLLVESASSKSNLTDDEIDHLLSDTMYFVSPIDAPVIESQVSTGELAILSADAIRREVSEWLVGLRSMNLAIQADLSFIARDFNPYTRKHSSYVQISNLQAPTPGYPDDVYEFDKIELQRKVSHREMVSSVEFQNLLLTRILILDNVTDTQGDSENHLARIISLVENELND